MNKSFKLIFILMFCPALAFAHVQQGDVGGFLSGASHPVLGYDHLLAMISVGVLSAQMGGKAIWSVPLTFVMVMVVGGLLGMVGVPLISVELGIAVSVIVLGIALAAEKKLPALLAMLCVGFFAVFHGHAHGTEMPSMVQPLLYVLGFITGTATIHLTGVVIGLAANLVPRGEVLLRVCGAGIACAGIHFLIG
jgi:urease accessory protein